MKTLIKKTLSEQIYMLLRDDILSGAIPQGSKLTLKQLQERFGVSSTAIREALIRLTQDGLAEYYANVGVKVVCLSKNDIRELFEYMGDLDALAIVYAARSEDRDALLQALQENIRQSDALLQRLPFTSEDSRQWALLSDRFHLLFYDYCDNSRLKTSAEKQRSQLTIFSNQYEAVHENQLNIESAHRLICNACLDGDFERAAALMRSHLQASLQYAMAYMVQE